MKILFSGICPLETTGYGIQTNHIIKALCKYDPNMDIGIICWNSKIDHNTKPGISTHFNINQVLRIYNVVGKKKYQKLYKNIKFYLIPKNYFNQHWDKIKSINDKFKCDKLIVYQDIWVFEKYNVKSITCEKYLYLPVHGDFITHKLLKFPNNINLEERTLDHLGFFDKIASFSLFGIEVLKKHGYEAHFIRHIVEDIHINKTKKELRKKYSILDKDFICLMVANNSEKSDRKAFTRQLQAFSLFSSTKKNIKLLIHTRSFENGALNLKKIAKKNKILHKIIITDHTISSSKQIRELYKLSDVLLCASKSEGFGLPMVEAQFMNLPVITTDCTAMSENTFYGIKTKPQEVSTVINMLNSWSNPSPMNIRNALEDIYTKNIEKYNFKKIDKNNYQIPIVFQQWKEFLNLQINGETIFNKHLLKIQKKLRKKKVRYIKHIKDCKYSAVFIETRNSPFIEPQLLNLLYLTDETMGIQIFYHNHNKTLIKSIIDKHCLLNISLVEIENNIRNAQEYNNFMFSEEFYKNLHGEKILIFQLDSLLLNKFDNKYFKYDWIGALWNDATLHQNKNIREQFKNKLPIGNGGFNIRNIKMCHEIAIKHNYTCPTINNMRFNEDNIYSIELQKTNAIFPTKEEAGNFSVETIKNLNPMAIHAAFKYFDKNESDLSYLNNLLSGHYTLIKKLKLV